MSHGYGGYKTATLPPNYITTCATPSYNTEAHKYSSDPSYYTEAPAYYITEAHLYYTTKAPEYYTTTYAVPAYYTEVPKHYTTRESEYYATTYAPPAYCTEAPKYYFAPAYYTKALNTTLHPATYPQLRRPSVVRYLLSTQRLLHRTTLIRITTRFQLTKPKSTLPPATTLKLLFTATPRHLSIIPLLMLLRPTTLNL
jgi:hypothetical protein